MFGYVRAAKPEMKVKEFESYKAVYCSLCKQLGKSYGILSRFTLSYDFTFLAVLNMALKDGCCEVERKRCVFNPLKKCNFCKETDDLNMPSAAAMIMIYYKLKDNIADEKGFKKLGYYMLLPTMSRAHKKAAKNYPTIEAIVSEYIKEQTAVEKEGCTSLDKAADPTAKALSQILSLCSESPSQKRVLERLGYCIGRYIYIIDAACDLERDIKTDSYNPLKADVTENINEYLKERAVPQLYFCANEAARAFELLEIKKFKTILGNIIYLGLEETFKKELNL